MLTILLMIGSTEIIVIALIILLLFGGAKIPQLMKGIGKGVNAYKKGLAGEDDNEEEKKQPLQQKTDKEAEE